MPVVGGKHYGYDKKGRKAAEEAKKKQMKGKRSK